MKKILVLVIAMTGLTGCGVAEHLNDCGGDLKELCYNAFGGRQNQSQSDAQSQAERDIVDLRNRVQALESQLNVTITQITVLSNSVTNNNTATLNMIQALQAQASTTLVQLAVLQGYKSIVSIKDPCGAQNNSWNEVFLKLSDGSYVASFSDNANGLNTRFTLLKDGSYVTTDGTNCHFTVTGNGTVITNEHN